MTALRPRLLLGVLRSLALLALCVPATAAAQAPLQGGSPTLQGGGDTPTSITNGPKVTAPPIQIVFDTSGSMGDVAGGGAGGGTERTKIEGAKVALLGFLRTVDAGTPVGLRTYPKGNGGCDSGIQRVPVALPAHDTFSAKIRSLTADGDTPTAEAMLAAADDLPSGGTLVVVSDGASTCDDPCEAAKTIADRGIDLQTITVGFDISGDGRDELQCIADALGGDYVDVDDADKLTDTIEGLSVAGLEMSALRYPRAVVADAAAGVRVTTTIANTGDRAATAATVRLRFDRNGTALGKATLQLGNVEPGAAPREVSWVFRPGVLDDGGAKDGKYHVRFSVILKASNVPSDRVQQGDVTVTQDPGPSAAGPILREGAKFAIVGDSYSAGEGAGDYFETRGVDGGCHRSLDTYVMRPFALPQSTLLACSGAVTANVEGTGRGETPPQTTQLTELLKARGNDVRGVILTMGGNDVFFGSIARTCLLDAGFDSCDKGVYKDWTPALVPLPWSWTGKDDFLRETVESSEMGTRLRNSYEAVNRRLNAASVVRARAGKVAPVLVLGYPQISPLTVRSCGNMLGLLKAEEMVFLTEFLGQLNVLVERSVRRARANGAAVWFVPDSELAFQPDHTVCDRDEYARHLKSYSVGGGAAELAHPNKRGYTALTSAVVRWSGSQAGLAAASDLATVKPQKDPPRPKPAQPLPGTPTRPDPFILDRGVPYAIPRTGGFAPGTEVRFVQHSVPRLLVETVADARGGVEQTITIPADTEPGDHELEIIGAAPDGSRNRKVIAFTIEGTRLPSAPILAAAVVGALLLLALFASWMARRSARRDGTPPPGAPPTGPQGWGGPEGSGGPGGWGGPPTSGPRAPGPAPRSAEPEVHLRGPGATGPDRPVPPPAPAQDDVDVVLRPNPRRPR